MSREIKFRAWDKQNKQFWYSDDEAFLLKEFDNILWLCEVVETYGGDHGNDGFEQIGIAEQYTGLKDKNGVELYDDDKFKGQHDFGPAGFSEREATVIFDSKLGYQWQYWKLETLEIIGNIHEAMKGEG